MGVDRSTVEAIVRWLREPNVEAYRPIRLYLASAIEFRFLRAPEPEPAPKNCPTCGCDIRSERNWLWYNTQRSPCRDSWHDAPVDPSYEFKAPAKDAGQLAHEQGPSPPLASAKAVALLARRVEACEKAIREVALGLTSHCAVSVRDQALAYLDAAKGG